MACECLLHLALDADLSTSFDELLCGAPPARLFADTPPRTRVCGVRQVNAVAQTAVLRLRPMPTPASSTAPDGSDAVPLALATLSSTVYAVLVLDAQQVPQLLSSATARRCPPHPSGAGPLGWYLDAVVRGLHEEAAQDAIAHASEGGNSSTPSVLSTTAAAAPVEVRQTGLHVQTRPPCVVHLSLIVVPNATIALSGLNATNVNASSAEAATLFSAAAAWAAARRAFTEVSGPASPAAAAAAGAPVTVAAAPPSEASVAAVELDLCATAAHVLQAAQMIAALGHKLLKTWTTTTTAATAANSPASGSVTGAAVMDAAAADVAEVRHDTQRKCMPTDFHALYTSMLTEVSSFSARKTMAAVAAFPTLCHLLEYVDGIVPADEPTTSATTRPGCGGGAGAVYSTVFGEHRSWNVLNSDIVEALVTEYER